ncbi:hypothetical protein [Streptomyces sp. NPDC005322]|uniref:hypothetical protein n=1 Tax=Streptomyces sp. NPDC005322 TaxID=3157032 RepID=UPI0033A000A2
MIAKVLGLAQRFFGETELKRFLVAVVMAAGLAAAPAHSADTAARGTSLSVASSAGAIMHW